MPFTSGTRRSASAGIGALSAAESAERQHAAGVGRVDDAVIPQPGAGVIGVALGFVLRADRPLERFLLLGRPGLAARFHGVAADRRQHAGGLLAAHDRDARVRPHPQEARVVGAAAHAVIAGAEAAADDDGEFRHLRGGDRGHHLGAVLGDAAGFVFAADHEAGDVLQEHQRNAALGAQLDEMRALQRALAEQDAVIGDDADRIAPDMREAGDEGGAVQALELVEVAVVDDAGDHLAHVVGLARDRPARRRRARPDRSAAAAARCERHVRLLAARSAPATMRRREPQRVGVVLGVVVGHAGDAACARRRRRDPRR